MDENKLRKESELRIGQEFYYLPESRSYMVMEATVTTWVYPDGEVFDESTEVKLKSYDSRVKTVQAEDLLEDVWKLINVGKANLPFKYVTHSVPNRSRLERTDD